MATNFPTSVDSFTNPTAVDTLDSPPHDQQHADVNDAVEAIETALLDGAPLHIDDANERVGIGTTSPTVMLDISGDAPHLRIHDTDTALSNDEDAGRIEFSNSDSGGAGGTGAYIGAVGDGSAGAQSLVFGAGSAGSPAEVLRIDGTSSRVGINDTTPSYTLDVNGDINATGDLRIGGTAIGEWTTFTPTFGNVTLGNGTVTAEYCQVNQIVFWRLKLIFGSTTAFTGDITVNFPVPADDNILGAAGGSVNCDDQSSTDYWGALYRLNVNSAYVRVLRADLTYVGQTGVNATTPFTWVAGDTLIIEDWYRPA